MSPPTSIRVITKPISRQELALKLGQPFEDMIKFVVDLDRRCIALGGELHADAEGVPLEQGSEQNSLWGGNYYPGLGERDCIQFTSMINLRPSQGNLALEVQSPELRARIRDLVHALVGRGEALT